ncbi:hypothetical protein IKQ19_14135 [Candidatus Saccharibacteria bacterium]|nr:hypothetical protein [Candidatus Saccharibacteria bacterium]
MKKSLSICLISLFLGGLFIACTSSSSAISRSVAARYGVDEAVIVDIKNVSPINNGIFEGWGTSLCWWGNRLGGDEIVSNEAVDLFFTQDKGIGLNIIRYNIGGGDDPTHNHITRSDSVMPGFWKNVDENGNFEYDWSADFRQRNVLKKIVSKVNENDLIVEFFSNSPPYFMTNSGCSSGAVKRKTDNIREDRYDDFAEYLAEVTYNLQNIDGIKVKSLEPMNEPRSDFSWVAFNPKQEGCNVGKGKNQSKLLLLTRQALDRKGLQNVIVSGCDEDSSGIQASSFTSLSQDAKNSIGRINTHTYWGERYLKLRNLAKKYEKDLWVSETDGYSSIGGDNGQMGPALSFAKKILDDMNGLRPSAWLIWQSIAGYISDTPFNGIVDGVYDLDCSQGFWGTAFADFVNKKIILSKKYYAFGQFTKYIRPGSYVIYTGLDNYIASYHPETKQVSIVCVNDSQKEKNCCFDLSSFVKKCGEIKAVRTSGKTLKEGENLSIVELPITIIEPMIFSAPLAPSSVTTFIIEGVESLENF